MGDQYTQNLKYLERNHKHIYNEVVSKGTMSSYVLRNNENGTLNIYASQLASLLYSKYDPVNECRLWIEQYQLDASQETDIVIYGLGLTYHLEAVLNANPNARVCIYEPEVELFNELMWVVDLETLFSHRQIMQISIGKTAEVVDEFIFAVSRYMKLDHKFIQIKYYQDIDLDFTMTFLKQYKHVLQTKISHFPFYRLFKKQPFINSVTNLSKMMTTPQLDMLENFLKGSTAIIVGGGPSLQHDVEFIKKWRDQLFVIAAGTSVQSLMYLGITPQLMVSMDPGSSNGKLFKRNDLSKIPLVYVPQIFSDILNVHSDNNVYAYFYQDEIISDLVDLKNNSNIFLPNLSVTGTAIQVAQYMGAGEIILAGQDLSYPGKIKYSPGAIHEESSSNDKLIPTLVYEVDNVQGGKNPTNYAMRGVLRDIERLIKQYIEVPVKNITHHGACIEGAEFVQHSTLLFADHTNVATVEDIRKVLKDSKNTQLIQQKELIVNKVELIITDLKNIDEQITVTINDIKKLVVLSRTKQNKAMDLFVTIENNWSNIIDTHGFDKVISKWLVLELYDYDQKFLNIEKEKQLIKKVNLLQEVLGKLLLEIQGQLPTMIRVYTQLQKELLSTNK